MLENKKKRGRERKVVATRLIRAEVRDRQESERRWHLVGLETFTREHFTHKEYPSRLMTSGRRVLATNDEREGDEERTGKHTDAT